MIAGLSRPTKNTRQLCFSLLLPLRPKHAGKKPSFPTAPTQPGQNERAKVKTTGREYYNTAWGWHDV